MEEVERVTLWLGFYDNATLRQILDARLNYAHYLMDEEPQSLIKLDESGYESLFELAQGNPGYLVYVFRQVLSSNELRESSERPYIITADNFRAVNSSLRNDQMWKNSHIKSAAVLNINRAGLRDTTLEETLISGFNKRR